MFWIESGVSMEIIQSVDVTLYITNLKIVEQLSFMLDIYLKIIKQSSVILIIDVINAYTETDTFGLQLYSQTEKIFSDSDRSLEIFNRCGIHNLSNIPQKNNTIMCYINY